MDMASVSTFIMEGVEFVEIIVNGVAKLIPIVIANPEASLVVGVIGYLKRNWIKRKIRQLLRYVMIGV